MDAKLEQSQEMMKEAEERHQKEKEYVCTYPSNVSVFYLALSQNKLCMLFH